VFSRLGALALIVLLFQVGCATGVAYGTPFPPQRGWGRGERGVPSHYAQSCISQPGACAPVGATGEIVVSTTAVRVVKAVEAIQGLITLKDYLDEAEVVRVEAVLVRCAREADFQVNEREYGPRKYPSDAECDRVVGRSSKGVDITRAMELGTMKHEAAFACVERELGSEFADHLTREPRYGKNPASGRYSITDRWDDSLVPDIVLHLVRDANRIQFLYDFLFPCTLASKSDPLASLKKLDKYRPLAGGRRRALVTPQLGISR
jgi:hypothetical protein